jgi:hypothetical protein
MQNPPRGPQLNVILDDDVALGQYSNLALVNASPVEFVLDFARVMPGTPRAKVLNRIIMTPSHAKALARNLDEMIKRFEASHGEIRLGLPQEEQKFFGFRTPTETASNGEPATEETP